MFPAVAAANASSGADPPAADANATSAFANSATDDGAGIDPNDFSAGYTDMQTLMLAGVCTLIVLAFGLAAGFAVRVAWRKLRERAGDGYSGVLQREDTSDPLGGGSKAHSGNLLVAADEVRLQDGAAKTTTTTFTTSSSPEHESVFVVEVTQPRGYSAVCGDATSAVTSDSTSQRAQVHREDAADDDEPADRSSNRGEDRQETDTTATSNGDSDEGVGAAAAEDDSTAAAAGGATRSNTGLSQSDLSVSSAGSSNPSYRYGNQLAYDGGHFGYPQYVGYLAGTDVPEVASATGVVETKHAHAQALQTRRPVCWGGQESMLSSDPRPQVLSDLMQEEILQEEQRQLGNGHEGGAGRAGLHRTGSLPPRVRDGKDHNGENSEGGQQEVKARLNPVSEVSGSVVGGATSPRKRGSLPVISTNLYGSFVSEKRASGSSPRFERLRNDISPLQEAVDRSPTDELDNGKENLQDGRTGNKADSPFENKGFVSSDQLTS